MLIELWLKILGFLDEYPGCVVCLECVRTKNNYAATRSDRHLQEPPFEQCIYCSEVAEHKQLVLGWTVKAKVCNIEYANPNKKDKE